MVRSMTSPRAPGAPRPGARMPAAPAAMPAQRAREGGSRARVLLMGRGRGSAAAQSPCVGAVFLASRRSGAAAGTGALRLAAAVALIAALLVLAVALPAGRAYAAGGSVALGVAVGTDAGGAASGAAGSVGLGVAVGVREDVPSDAGGPSGGTVSIGASVGYREAARQHAVSFDAGRGSFLDGGSVVERAVPEGGRPKAPADPERPGWRFVGWFGAGAPDASWDADGESVAPLGEAWDPAAPVTGDLALHAKWARLSGAGSVALGVEVAQRVEGPSAGDSGSVLLGAEVALRREGASGPNGTVPIGAEVAFREPAREVTVAFDAGKGSFADGSSLREAVTEANAPVAAPEGPKRPGWRFAGWHLAGASDPGWDAEGESAVPLGAEWDFSRGVAGDTRLHAKWELRLDVTVPVSVAFAVDASTGEAIGPDPGRYALKSRTVRDVEVESLSLECRLGELEAFFEGPAAGWQNALAATSLSLEGERAPSIELPFADGSSAGPTWRVAHPLTDAERAQWRVPAFAYGATSPDDAWQGADPSQRFALDVGLTIADGLEVKAGQPGAVPIAHLKVTVSARP